MNILTSIIIISFNLIIIQSIRAADLEEHFIFKGHPSKPKNLSAMDWLEELKKESSKVELTPKEVFLINKEIAQTIGGKYGISNVKATPEQSHFIINVIKSLAKVSQIIDPIGELYLSYSNNPSQIFLDPKKKPKLYEHIGFILTVDFSERYKNGSGKSYDFYSLNEKRDYKHLSLNKEKSRIDTNLLRKFYPLSTKESANDFFQNKYYFSIASIIGKSVSVSTNFILQQYLAPDLKNNSQTFVDPLVEDDQPFEGKIYNSKTINLTNENCEGEQSPQLPCREKLGKICNKFNSDTARFLQSKHNPDYDLAQKEGGFVYITEHKIQDLISRIAQLYKFASYELLPLSYKEIEKISNIKKGAMKGTRTYSSSIIEMFRIKSFKLNLEQEYQKLAKDFVSKSLVENYRSLTLLECEKKLKELENEAKGIDLAHQEFKKKEESLKRSIINLLKKINTPESKNLKEFSTCTLKNKNFDELQKLYAYILHQYYGLGDKEKATAVNLAKDYNNNFADQIIFEKEQSNKNEYVRNIEFDNKLSFKIQLVKHFTHTDWFVENYGSVSLIL